jgi:hypothetical protein
MCIVGGLHFRGNLTEYAGVVADTAVDLYKVYDSVFFRLEA